MVTRFPALLGLVLVAIGCVHGGTSSPTKTAPEACQHFTPTAASGEVPGVTGAVANKAPTGMPAENETDFAEEDPVFSRHFEPKKIRETYVKDFDSTEPNSCHISDVALSHSQAEAFFKRAKIVDHRTMNENYAIAPCWISGVLIYGDRGCDFEIYAGGTGNIKCDKRIVYFVCDTCTDIFNPTPSACNCGSNCGSSTPTQATSQKQ